MTEKNEHKQSDQQDPKQNEPDFTAPVPKYVKMYDHVSPEMRQTLNNKDSKK